MKQQKGNTMSNIIWFTGISGAGKTTLSLLLKKELEKKCGHVEFIDGDVVRDFFENDLGYSRKERILNVKRIAFAAMLVAKNGTNVIVANIAPYYEVRDFIRKHIPDYIQIYLKVSTDEVIKRDVKGHYKKYNEGKINNLIGVDDNYDIPRNPDLTVDTELESESDSLKKILKFLENMGV
jgi:adenylylsulfate kinase